jgi:hypothetical protein
MSSARVWVVCVVHTIARFWESLWPQLVRVHYLPFQFRLNKNHSIHICSPDLFHLHFVHELVFVCCFVVTGTSNPYVSLTGNSLPGGVLALGILLLLISLIGAYGAKRESRSLLVVVRRRTDMHIASL